MGHSGYKNHISRLEMFLFYKIILHSEKILQENIAPIKILYNKKQQLIWYYNYIETSLYFGSQVISNTKTSAEFSILMFKSEHKVTIKQQIKLHQSQNNKIITLTLHGSQLELFRLSIWLYVAFGIKRRICIFL